MTKYQTGLQIDNKTGLTIVYGEIYYPTADIADNNIASFFTDPHTNRAPNVTLIWGTMDLQTQNFIDCHVDLIDTPNKPIEFKFQFSNGQYVSFSSIASDVYEEIHPPQWVPDHGWGIPKGARLAFGVERWTRHDPAIKKVYPYGLITFTLSDVTNIKSWMTVTKSPGRRRSTNSPSPARTTPAPG